MNRMERGPMTRSRGIPSIISLFALILSFAVAAPLSAQVPRPANFLAKHYDVSATLDSIGQSLSATAKIDLVAIEASSNVRVELHPNLVVKEVKGPEGKPLTFERDNQNPLFVNVQLLTPVATNGHVTLSFIYSGLLFNEENSPVPGVKAASITKEGAYLLLPARWFPLTDYPSNRYTATFRLNLKRMPSKVAGCSIHLNASGPHSMARSSPATCSSIRSRLKGSALLSTLLATSPRTRKNLPPTLLAPPSLSPTCSAPFRTRRSHSFNCPKAVCANLLPQAFSFSASACGIPRPAIGPSLISWPRSGS